ncbi:LytR C-terminal domain-containing protein [Candidatus Microgenomates bacterium]|nr:LytR C-terminal domain-containing protein [Candidatus Microgenomates bacterium]
MIQFLKLKSSIIVIIILATLLILTTTGAAVYFYFQYQATAKLLPGKTAAVDESKKIIEMVGKLIQLPENEQPSVATVTDPEKLKDQPFFARAKTGDKVLIFNNAKKAILYDPIANKIIDVSPININTSSPSANLANKTPTPMPLKIALYNGTDVVGITARVEKELKDKIDNIDIPIKENAKKKDYPDTLIIDLIGNKPQVVEQLAKVLKGKISTLPDGEVGTNLAEIMIIVGADKK